MKKQEAETTQYLTDDFNAVVGEGKDEEYMGHHGLGQRNETGRKLVEFCRRRQMYVTKTRFTQDKRRRYTGKQLRDIRRYKIDYVITKFRTIVVISHASKTVLKILIQIRL